MCECRIIQQTQIADKKEMPMAKLLLCLAIIFGAASFAFYTATNGAAGDAPNWASTVCTAVQPLCQSPGTAAIAATVLAVFWILFAFLSSARD
jgi:hypothetical protein